jgi:putative RecB family exonuclease
MAVILDRSRQEQGGAMTRPHWSYNQLSKYLRCPLQFYFDYVLGIPRRIVPSGQALGSAVHEALAVYHQSIKDGKPVGADAVRTSFLEAWERRAGNQVIQFGPGEQAEAILDQGISLLDAYLSEPPPENIIAIEETLIAPVCTSQGEILEKPLVAVVDLLTQDNEGLAITDFKTAGRSFSESEAATSLQPTCYVNNVGLIYGEPASFQFTVLVKTKTPRVQRLEANRNEADLGRLGDLIQTVERAVEADIFYPVESPLNCSGCPYRRPCREWAPLPPEEQQIPTIPMLDRTQPC